MSDRVVDRRSALERQRRCACEVLEGRHLLSAGSVNFDPLVSAVSGFQFDYHNGVTTQTDGKILVAGYVGTSGTGSGEDIAIARYNSNGTLDTSYGSGGVATLATAGDQEAKSISLDSSGNAIVAGTSLNGAFSFAVARFTPTGQVDASFNGTGLATASFASGMNALAYSVAVQPDGRVIAAGETFDGWHYEFALARFTTAGNLDPSFDGNGLLTAQPITASSNDITGIALQPNGQIVAVGTSTPGLPSGSTKFIVTRYNADGTQDTSFGGGGVVVANFGSGNVAGAIGVTLQADGRIVAAGSVTNSTSGVTNFALTRYLTNGAIDTSFNGTGLQTIAFDNSDRGEAVAMQTIGGTQKIVVSGSSGSNGEFAIARLNLSGSLDTSFNSSGKLLVPVAFPGNTGIERAPGLAIETMATPYASNIVLVGVDTHNEAILTSVDGNTAGSTGGLPNVVWVDDSWTLAVDTGAAGLSTGDIVYDAITGTTATWNVDAFSTIPDGINGVATNGRIDVLGGSDHVFASAVFTLNNNKTIDLSDNSLIVHHGVQGTWNGSAYTGLTGLVESGRNGGMWNGVGIVTSQSNATSPTLLTTLAVENPTEAFGISTGGSTTWRGQTVVGTDVLIAYTYNGDANLDGRLNGDDYYWIDSHVNFSGSVFGFHNGDFNYDGHINGDDYFLIDFNINIQGPAFSSAHGATLPGVTSSANNSIIDPDSQSTFSSTAIESDRKLLDELA